MKTGLKEKCEALAKQLGGEIVAAGERHAVDAAIERRVKPRWVVRQKKPGQDLATFRSWADCWAWLQKEQAVWDSLYKASAQVYLSGRIYHNPTRSTQ